MLDDGAADPDQIEGGPSEDVLVSRETRDEFFLVSQGQVFAYYDRLLRHSRAEGYRLRSVVALELCLYFFVGDWAGPFKTFVLCREAVYVPLPWDEVPFNIARSLLVAINYDHALRTRDFHAEVKSVNGLFKLVDGALAHYGVVWVYHVDDVEGDLLTSCIGCYTK